MEQVIDVDPCGLRMPHSKPHVDVTRLVQHLAKHGSSVEGMPPVWLSEDPQGLYVLVNGVTRATRACLFTVRGTLIPAVVIDRVRRSLTLEPTVKAAYSLMK